MSALPVDGRSADRDPDTHPDKAMKTSSRAVNHPERGIAALAETILTVPFLSVSYIPGCLNPFPEFDQLTHGIGRRGWPIILIHRQGPVGEIFAFDHAWPFSSVL